MFSEKFLCSLLYSAFLLQLSGISPVNLSLAWQEARKGWICTSGPHYELHGYKRRSMVIPMLLFQWPQNRCCAFLPKGLLKDAETFILPVFLLFVCWDNVQKLCQLQIFVVLLFQVVFEWHNVCTGTKNMFIVLLRLSQGLLFQCRCL